MRDFNAFRFILSVGCLLTLCGALQSPAQAQSSLQPLTEFQVLGPEHEENFPPGAEFGQSTLFGQEIAVHGNTALIQESEFPQADNPLHVGRVAVFTRNSAGLWDRSGSIDPPAEPADSIGFGSPLALFGDVALIGSSRGMYVFHRQQGAWKRVQLLRLKTPWQFTDAALNGAYAFLATELQTQGVVYAYRVTPSGRLHYLQRLDSGVDFDSYAQRVEVSGDRVVVSAVDDADGRGAAHVFKRQGKRWKKEQKLVAVDGTSGDHFSASVAITGDWIAVSAPDFNAGPGGCIGGKTTGAIYVFHNVNGTWSQQQLISGLDVLEAQGNTTCVTTLGGDALIAGGKWIIATSVLPSEGPYTSQAYVLRREAGQYTPVSAVGVGGPTLTPALAGETLFVGEPVEIGCNFEFCPGSASLYHLDQLGN